MLVRESLFVRAEAVCAGIPTTEIFGMTRNIRQGGVESTWTFNLVIKMILARKKAKLAECGILRPILAP